MFNKRLPQVYLGKNDQSLQAQELLNTHNIRYILIIEHESTNPTIQSKDGEFVGIDGIKSYIELVLDLDSAL